MIFPTVPVQEEETVTSEIEPLLSDPIFVLKTPNDGYFLFQATRATRRHFS